MFFNSFKSLFFSHAVTLKLYDVIYQQQDDGFLKLLDLANCGFCQDLGVFSVII